MSSRKHFHTNHYGLWKVYNGANKGYLVGGIVVPIVSDSSHAAGYQSPRASVEDQLHVSPLKRNKMLGKPLTPVDTRQ